jgi:hypothetical protein
MLILFLGVDVISDVSGILAGTETSEIQPVSTYAIAQNRISISAETP